MNSHLNDILNKSSLTKADIVYLLKLNNPSDLDLLFQQAVNIRNEYCGAKVFFRGLIEISNICRKNCLYCGIRIENKAIVRYDISEKEIIDTAFSAWDNGLASIVLQSGERTDKVFIHKIIRCLQAISDYTQHKMRITLSLGEQKKETYKLWKEAGADAYLLRIETSDSDLFRKIHPDNRLHRFEDRLRALEHLKEIGFQVGTGVMIGLPFQSIESLADDLIFIQNLDADMAGMGPYLEHQETPLFLWRNHLTDVNERLLLTLKMYAILRILMKDINIASTTATDAISSSGRLKGILAGANVIMPDITPEKYLGKYTIYPNKPVSKLTLRKVLEKAETMVKTSGCEPVLADRGDPVHYLLKSL